MNVMSHDALVIHINMIKQVFFYLCEVEVQVDVIRRYNF